MSVIKMLSHPWELDRRLMTKPLSEIIFFSSAGEPRQPRGFDFERRKAEAESSEL